MRRPGVAIWGVPLNNVDLDEAVKECLAILQEDKQQKIPHHITTIDSSLIAKIYGWACCSPHNPELLAIARKTYLAAPSQKSLTWLCSMLGSSLPDPFTPSQLMIKLCQALGERQKGIFLLGGNEKIAKMAAISIRDNSPGLRIVGIATPPIFTEGEDLSNAQQRDALLLEQIHSSHADLLLVNLGCPKQELWFGRVRQALSVPIVLNVENAFDLIAENSSTPIVKSFDLKKLLQTCVDYIKLKWISIPLIFYHSINRLVFALFHARKQSDYLPSTSQLFLSPNRTIAVIPLPSLIDATNVHAIAQRFEEASSHDVLVFDFRNIRHIQPEGFRLLIKMWLRRRRENQEIYVFSPTADIRCLMKLHRIWDIYENISCNSAEMLVSRLVHRDKKASFYDAIYQKGSLVVVSLLGALDNTLDYDEFLKRLSPIISDKNCAIDFSFCSIVDNTGFSFLLSLRKQFQNQQRTLTLCSLSKNVLQQFRLVKLDSLFSIVNSIEDVRE